MAIDQFESLLSSKANRAQAGETAPAYGLTLMSVKLGRKNSGS
jgi:hypothetical protein